MEARQRPRKHADTTATLVMATLRETGLGHRRRRSVTSKLHDRKWSAAGSRCEDVVKDAGRRFLVFAVCVRRRRGASSRIQCPQGTVTRLGDAVEELRPIQIL